MDTPRDAPPLHAVTCEISLADGVGLPDLLPRLDPVGVWLREGQGIVGLGTAASTESSGSQRFGDLAHWWERCRRRIRGAEPPPPLVGVPGCGPTVFTSVTFSSRSSASSLLTLPEVMVGDVGGHRWVTVVGAREPVDLTETLRRHGLHLDGGRLSLDADPHSSAGPSPETVLREGSRSPAHYLEAVAAGVESIAERRLEKLVLARDVVVSADEPLHAGTVLAHLARSYAGCWTYRAQDVLGTTPEMLVTVRQEKLAARVLAGTVDRSVGPDRARTLLLEDPKQRTEHEIAVQSLLSQLAPVVEVISAQNPPSVLELPNVFHLSTDVTGRLARTSDGRGAEALPAALLVAERAHPTAAVCGTPTATAADLIPTLEELDRGPFAGPVGWIDAAGNADFGIALRGGVLEDSDRSIRLFAGCGIVEGSRPEEELAETWAKMRPMLTALGLEAPADARTDDPGPGEDHSAG
ncbi:MAG: isochorismate synthase [Nesterenkonia sp.]|nr:isochorismate synthase [Nesterenkonia sp.]